MTKEDLQLFRMQLLNDIRELFAPRENGVQKQWLKNSDVRQLLKISSNTVQRLRIAGKLKSSKVGGVHYYRYEDVQQLLESGLKIAS
ncbi:MAG TPA: helix-turn-helix domain-containing protein [Flavisolibacter sp.]|nr:helix-turn-helix domain-containing protein [Flavisolibacter sp.]